MGASDQIIDAIEGGALADFLGRQRWFAGRSRGLESVRLLDESSPGALGIERAGLAIVLARHLDGSSDPYFVPWKQADGESGEDRWTIAEGLRDGLSDPTIARALLDRTGRPEPIPMNSGGRIVGVPTRSFDEFRGRAGESPVPEYGRIEQSHSALKFGDHLFLKVFRRLEPGINPDFEVGRFLNERTDFRNVPVMAGAIEYHRIGSLPMTLAILQSWVESRGTAWDCSQKALDRLFRLSDEGRVDALRAEEKLAEKLGARTGELHRALASCPDDPDFAPRPIRESDVTAFIEEARGQLRRTMAALREHLPDLPAEVRPEALSLLGCEPDLEQRLGGLGSAEPRGLAIRIHGDYHLGQVLRTADDDYAILDFEGEPGQPLQRRRAHHPAPRDVVGMLRSFDYAAHSALFGPIGDSDRPAGIAFEWRDRASAAFLRGYREATRHDALMPPDSVAWFRALMLHKALYELLYELNQRPDWVRVPLRGLLALADPTGRHLPD